MIENTIFSPEELGNFIRMHRSFCFIEGFRRCFQWAISSVGNKRGWYKKWYGIYLHICHMDWAWPLLVEGQKLLELLKSSEFAIWGTSISTTFLRIQWMTELLSRHLYLSLYGTQVGHQEERKLWKHGEQKQESKTRITDDKGRWWRLLWMPFHL